MPIVDPQKVFKVNGVHGLLRGLRLSGATLFRKEDGTVAIKHPPYTTKAAMVMWMGGFAPRVKRLLQEMAAC